MFILQVRVLVQEVRTSTSLGTQSLGRTDGRTDGSAPQKTKKDPNESFFEIISISYFDWRFEIGLALGGGKLNNGGTSNEL